MEKLTEERLDEVLAVFLRDFEAGAVEARGWPMYCSAYKVAKTRESWRGGTPSCASTALIRGT